MNRAALVASLVTALVLSAIAASLPNIAYAVQPSGGGQKAALGTLPRLPVLLPFYPDPSAWARFASIAVSRTSSSYAGAGIKVVELPEGIETYVALRAGYDEQVVIYTQPALTPSDGPLMIIIGPRRALHVLEDLASLHRAEGLRVQLVSVEEIYANYSEAEMPPGTLDPGEKAAPEYNLTLALRIISFLRESLEHGARYVLLVGQAGEVPPIYYWSPLLHETVSPIEAAVPTDYYYADPDYDGDVELAVGRLPFSSVEDLLTYVAAAKRWVEGGEWAEKAFVSGGATFATTLYVGEEIVADVQRLLSTMGLDVDQLLLSQGGYAGTRFSGFIGRYGLYYIVAHGSGSSLVDYVPGGLWNYEFEEKLSSNDVHPTQNPGVYMLPACRDGFWDIDLVEPPFTPPSLSIALLKRGAAVAYVGFARITFEVIDTISFQSGRLVLGYAGADLLLRFFVENLGSASTLGEAWRRALNSYMASRASGYKAYLTLGEENIAELIVREAVFLGDPALLNRYQGRVESRAFPLLEPLLPASRISGWLLVPQLVNYASGSLYLVNPGLQTTTTFRVSGECPQAASAVALYRIYGYTLVEQIRLDASIEQSEGNCYVKLHVPISSPSLVRIALYTSHGPEFYYVAVAGASIEGNTVIYRGLDMIGLVGDEPLILVLRGEDGSVTALMPSSLPSFNVTLPPGTFEVEISPLYRYEPLLAGSRYADSFEKLLEHFKVRVRSVFPLKLDNSTEFTASSNYGYSARAVHQEAEANMEPVSSQRLMQPYATIALFAAAVAGAVYGLLKARRLVEAL
jgi:hypothetical protein